MARIDVGFIFNACKRAGEIRPGLHRIVEIQGDPKSAKCNLVIIQIPAQPPPRQPGEKQPNYYATGFKVALMESVRTLLDEQVIVEASAPPIPPWWAKTDADLLDECERNRWIRQGEIWVTPEIQTREKKWAWIEPLVLLAESGTIISVVDLGALVPARAKELGVSPNQIYNALHRYYAFGQNKDALLPNTPNSGGRGQERYGRNGVRLGAPNTSAKFGNTTLVGRVSDPQDRQNMRDGYQLYVRPGVSREEAFLSFSSTYYSDGYKIENGYQLPLLLPARQRPTIREFFDHGPNKQNRESMLCRMFGEGEWAKNYRPLVGTAQDGIFSVGAVGSIDASPIDVNLVSCFNPHFPIGVPRGLFIREATLGLWCGAHNVIGGPGTADAKLTILRAALSKVNVLNRLGLSDISPEDFPNLHYLRLLSDNGELRSIDGIETCASKVRTAIEFIESGRADRNSISEGGHHSRHARLDHKLPGTTLGRRPLRGEALPITKALLSLYGYERLLWQWMHWSNTKQLVPHLVPTEMKKDMGTLGKSFSPTRIAIFQWAKEKGYVIQRPTDPVHLKSNLLPEYTATVARNGLILHRPGTGDRVELLHGSIFNSDYIEQSCLYHSFGYNRPPHIRVRVDPNDLSELLYIDDRGIHIVPNTTNDQIVIREYYLADLIAGNDSSRLRALEIKSDIDQAASDLRLSRAAEADLALSSKNAATQAEKPNKSKRSRDGVRVNQAKERQAQLDLAASRAADTASPSITRTEAIEPDHTPPAPGNGVAANPESRLKKALEDRMKSFLAKGK